MRTSPLVWLTILSSLLALPVSATKSDGEVPTTELLISAASSLTEVFTRLASQFEQRHPDTRIRLNFAGSGVLAAQVEQGAPVSALALAGPGPLTRLLDRDPDLVSAVRTFATGELVVVARADPRTMAERKREDRLTEGEKNADPSFLQRLADTDGRLAIANPKLAPAGTYAQRSLEAIGVSDSFRGRLVLADNVRAVLRYVETGVASAGVVYRTDAAASPHLQVVEAIAPEHSGLILYPIVALDPAAQLFVDFVCGESGQKTLRDRGFFAPVNGLLGGRENR